MTLFRRSFVFAAATVLVAAVFAASLAAVASAESEGRSAARAKATVKVSKCRSASAYADRRLEFRAAMSALPGATKMELRYTVYRRYAKQSRYRVVRPAPGNSLGEWLSSTVPSATKYVHTLAVTPVETAAVYRVRVNYRWKNADGKVVKRAKRTSRLCKQRRGLPNLDIVSVQRYPNGGELFPEYPVVWVVTVRNNGSSSASLSTSPILAGTANGALTDGTVNAQPLDPFDTILAGGTMTRHLYGQECHGGPVEITVDPMKVVRERNENDNTFRGAC